MLNIIAKTGSLLLSLTILSSGDVAIAEIQNTFISCVPNIISSDRSYVVLNSNLDNDTFAATKKFSKFGISRE